MGSVYSLKDAFRVGLIFLVLWSKDSCKYYPLLLIIFGFNHCHCCGQWDIAFSILSFSVMCVCVDCVVMMTGNRLGIPQDLLLLE